MAVGRGIIDRVLGLGPLIEHRASEIIGRYTMPDTQVAIYKSRTAVKSVDETVPDYEFWDKLRRGKAAGYRLASLFCRRIEIIFAAWILGRMPTVSLAESGDHDNPDDPRNYTDSELARFLSDHHTLLMQVYCDHLGLGDQYIIVNADGSLSVPPPNTVTEERDPYDYRKITAVRVETKLDAVTIIDEYRPDRRTVTVKKGTQLLSEQVFANLIGRIPVVHVAWARSGNETHGHSIHEELLPLYDQYDDVLFKQLDGAKLLGNPLLAFVGMENIQEVLNVNQPAETETYVDQDGHESERPQLTVDQNAVLLVGKGGDAKFVAPPTGFTADTKEALKSLFLLLLDHTGIPEFLWGGEMGQARASTNDQLIQWVHEVEGYQAVAGGWIVELCEIWLQIRALVDAAIVVDRLVAEWPALIERDENTKQMQLQFAHDNNLITDQTALEQLHLVKDAQREIEKARAEAEERRAALFPDGMSDQFASRLERDTETEEEAT